MEQDNDERPCFCEIGRQKMQDMGMLPLESGFSQDYDPDLNPTILNEFATAAFRFGHTLVQGQFESVTIAVYN